MTITILDGGMGQELIRRAGGKATPLWSTQALLDAPEIVRAVHDDYFAAGAEIATADSYAILPDRLEPYGFGGRLGELQTLACRIAAEARDAHGSGRVGGALGPLGFSYQPDKAPPADEAAEIYAKVAAHQAPIVDFHICETMASVDQARGALMGAGTTGKPVWLSITVDDTDGTKLRSGEAVTDILPLVAEFAPEVLLLNCSAPEAITSAVPLLAGHGTPVGAYANGFVKIAGDFSEVGATVDMLEARKDLDPETYAGFAARWIDSGATLVGGCCEVGPDHIRLLADRFGGKS